MPTPTIVGDWRFQVSQSIAGANSSAFRQSLLLALANSLRGLGSWTDDEGVADTVDTPWTIVSSSDSTVAGAADHWDAAGDLVWNAEASAHSWAVFTHADFFGTANPLHMLLVCGPNATINATLGIVFSRVGFTGGSTTARPTATDEHIARPIAGTVATAGWQGDDNNTAASVACRLHVLMTANGRRFKVFMTRASLCIAQWSLFDCEADAGWTEAYLFKLASADFASGAEAEVLTETNEDNGASRLWYANEAGGVGDFTAEIAIPYHGVSLSASVMTLALNGFNGGWLPLQVPLIGLSPATVAPIAIVPDCWFARAAAGTGSPGEDVDTETDRFMQFGIYLVPWNDSTIVLG